MLDTEPPLAIPHFEEQLLGRLQERQRSGAWPPVPEPEPEPEPGPASGRRSAPGTHRDGRHIRRVAAAAGITLLIGAAAVAVGTRGDGGGQADVESAAEGQTEEPDSVIDQVIAALDTAVADGDVLYTTFEGHGVTNEVWVDLRSGAERSIVPASTGGSTMDFGRSDAPALDAGPEMDEGSVPRRYVDHCRKEYADRDEPGLYSFNSVPQLLSELETGDFEVSGPIDVDGRSLLKISTAGEPTGSEVVEPDAQAADEQAAEDAAELDQQQVIYVDPATHLPVYVEQTSVGSGENLEFLPRTAENLELLVTPIPAGYAQVEQLALDEVRSAGCVD